MFKIPKQEYTAEFKELAAKRVKDGQELSVRGRRCRCGSGRSAKSRYRVAGSCK